MKCKYVGSPKVMAHQIFLAQPIKCTLEALKKWIRERRWANQLERWRIKNAHFLCRLLLPASSHLELAWPLPFTFGVCKPCFAFSLLHNFAFYYLGPTHFDLSINFPHSPFEFTCLIPCVEIGFILDFAFYIFPLANVNEIYAPKWNFPCHLG